MKELDKKISKILRIAVQILKNKGEKWSRRSQKLLSNAFMAELVNQHFQLTSILCITILWLQIRQYLRKWYERAYQGCYPTQTHKQKYLKQPTEDSNCSHNTNLHYQLYLLSVNFFQVFVMHHTKGWQSMNLDKQQDQPSLQRIPSPVQKEEK